MQSISNNKIYQADIGSACQAIPDFHLLAGKSILVTGGTGLIGDPIVRMLVASEANVFVGSRSEQNVIKKFGDEVTYLPYDANEELVFNQRFDYIIHAASNAFPSLISAQPVETILSNVLGTHRLLEYAKEKEVGRFLFVSSSEVYGINPSPNAMTESDYGYVDFLNTRSSYPMGKRTGETLCKSYLEEYGVDTVIVRPGHIYGPSASVHDNRISSQFAYQAARGENLMLKSAGSQIRSYLYGVDCASAVLTVLLKGKSGEAYNISDEKSKTSIRQLAELLAHFGGVNLLHEAPTEIERKAFNPMDNSTLNNEKLRDLGWEAKFDTKTGIQHTIEILKWILAL